MERGKELLGLSDCGYWKDAYCAVVFLAMFFHIGKTALTDLRREKDFRKGVKDCTDGIEKKEEIDSAMRKIMTGHLFVHIPFVLTFEPLADKLDDLRGTLRSPFETDRITTDTTKNTTRLLGSTVIGYKRDKVVV